MDVPSAASGPEGASGSALPPTYGESHVLLLARDPKTLFAAWDLSPSFTESLKSRIGRRAFAVSTQTLRLIPGEGETTVLEVEKQDRTRYLSVSGASSFIAEIGFTTPAGRFEFAARSSPCFVPMNDPAPGRSGETASRLLVRYREAASLARAGVRLASVGRLVGSRSLGQTGALARPAAGSRIPASRRAAASVLGGASDLYRR